MEGYNKYVIATADIDGETKEFYRYKKNNDFYTPKHYTSHDIKSLRSSIEENNHLIRLKFNRVGYFFSDISVFCKLYYPEVICHILQEFYKYKNIDACGQGDDFIVYTDKIDHKHAVNMYNDHFNGNLY